MFKPRILTTFLMGRFFKGFGTVMLVVCGIIFSITFVERLPSNTGAIPAMMDAWVRLLEYMPMFMPLAVFMGTLMAYYTLTKSTENIIVASSGMSPYQGARPFLFGAALIGILATALVNPYSVRLSTKNITAEHLTLVDWSLWIREASENGTITLRAENVRTAGNILYFQNARIFKQNTESKLVERIEATEVKLSDTGLDAVRAKVWNARGVLRISNWHTDTLLNPKTVIDRYMLPAQISFWDLPGFIKKMEKIGAPTRGHLVQFWTLLFMPLTMISMTILGVAFSQTRQRRNFNFGIKFGIGIITCFGLYFLVNLFNALGANGTLPAFLAIIAPPLIIIAAAGTFITSYDTI